MLKSQIKSIRKELEQIPDNQEVKIYFVDEIGEGEEYIVKSTPDGSVVFQGNRAAYEAFGEKHHRSYFIQHNIPRPKCESLYVLPK